MSDTQIPNSFNLKDIPAWVHVAWMTVLGVVWKGKPAAKAIVGIATFDSRLSKVEDDLLKVQQRPQVTKEDIDTLRGELQGTLQANQSSTLSEIRFLFTGQKKDNDDFKKELKDDIFKRYSSLDDLIQRIDDKVKNGQS